MSKKITVLQYLPYFPPHAWWLESHAAQRAKHWVKNNFGPCTVVTSDIWQPINTIIYEVDGYTVCCLPSYELLSGFPIPKFRSKQYREIHRYLKKQEFEIIITRTRFFLSSILWWIYAYSRRIKRVHIEHGVDYVKMNAKRKEIIAWLYDQLIGSFIFIKADSVICISHWCKHFVNRFTKREIPVIYRGVEFLPKEKKKVTACVHIGFVGRLTALKWVNLLIEAVAIIKQTTHHDLQLHIVWDWEECQKLKQYAQSMWIGEFTVFYWYKDQNYLQDFFYPTIDICVNASWQEWLPTSVIEGLLAKCVVVATKVWWTPEISSNGDLILVEPGNSDLLANGIKRAIEKRNQVAWKSYQQIKGKFTRWKNMEAYYSFFAKLLLSWK